MCLLVARAPTHPGSLPSIASRAERADGENRKYSLYLSDLFLLKRVSRQVPFYKKKKKKTASLKYGEPIPQTTVPPLMEKDTEIAPVSLWV